MADGFELAADYVFIDSSFEAGDEVDAVLMRNRSTLLPTGRPAANFSTLPGEPVGRDAIGDGVLQLSAQLGQPRAAVPKFNGSGSFELYSSASSWMMPSANPM